MIDHAHAGRTQPYRQISLQVYRAFFLLLLHRYLSKAALKLAFSHLVMILLLAPLCTSDFSSIGYGKYNQ